VGHHPAAGGSMDRRRIQATKAKGSDQTGSRQLEKRSGAGTALVEDGKDRKRSQSK